ncbi:MAG TPA: hypothetical protein VNB49_17825, partial [Candidatus Dormibacteraeota bacterium]|nr:hypothetical protein [Candidatus Dormibacteraeota bacterium]
IYSNLINIDRGAAARPAVPNAPAAVPVRPVVANASVNAPAYAQPTSDSQAASMPITTSPAREKPAAQAGPLFPTPPMPSVTGSDMASGSEKSSSARSAPVETASSPAPASAVNVRPAAPAPSAQPTAPAPSQPSAPAETQPAAAQSTPTQSAAPGEPGPLFTPPPPRAPTSSSADTISRAASAPEPAPAAAPEPQPEAVEPARVRTANVRSSWEQPMPGVHQNFLFELYSGYAFARFTSGGSSTNLHGGMGSFAYNLKPWLQIGGDTSYNFVTLSGTKNTLYGNHFGGRFFYHRGGRWAFTPFVEALVGGSRLDTSGGVTTSQNCISYKAGGGVDIRASRHWEIRLINVDYYRTTFGPAGYQTAQNNYWATAGVVLRLFGSGASE